MRRNEKEISDQNQIWQIIHESKICRIALSHNNLPYMIPMNFADDGKFIYLHCAEEGLKIDILKNNPNICFETEINTELVAGETGCGFGMKYKSVIAFGKAEFITEWNLKKKAFDLFFLKYAGEVLPIREQQILSTCVIRITLMETHGKCSGY